MPVRNGEETVAAARWRRSFAGDRSHLRLLNRGQRRRLDAALPDRRALQLGEANPSFGGSVISYREENKAIASLLHESWTHSRVKGRYLSRLTSCDFRSCISPRIT